MNHKPKRILRPSAVSERLGSYGGSLDRLRRQPGFPRPFKLSDDPKCRAIGWLESDVEAWIERRAAAGRAEAA